MIKTLLKTDDNLASTLLRVMLGVLVLLHGVGKLGSGFETFMGYMSYLELPAILGYVTLLIEILGSLFLIFGVATRLNAVLMFSLFVGMIVSVHAQYGLMMNWFGQMEAGQEGFEYHLLVLAMCASLIVLGGGKLSADGYILKKMGQ